MTTCVTCKFCALEPVTLLEERGTIRVCRVNPPALPHIDFRLTTPMSLSGQPGFAVLNATTVGQIHRATFPVVEASCTCGQWTPIE